MSDINYQIGNISLVLPSDHLIHKHQRAFKLYNKRIGSIANTIYEKYPDCIGVDVGANIGDTAAEIRNLCNMQLVCIEGSPIFHTYLLKNQKQIKNMTPVLSYIGRSEAIIKSSAVYANGNATITSDINETIHISNLLILLKNKDIDLDKIKLLKTDTEGFDYDILMGCEYFIIDHKPNIFFEYQIESDSDFKKSREVISLLSSLGYKFIVYSNYGNYMMSINEDINRRFEDLNMYIFSSVKYNGGLGYADIFASTEDDILSKIYKEEKELVEKI